MAKNKIGRPTKYKEEYCSLLVEHMAKGYSFESFAAVVEVNDDTLWEWAKVHPEFSDAKRLAFAKNRHFWESVGLEGLYMGGKENPFNATVWVFNMKNRFGWSDKREVELNNKVTLEDLVTKSIKKDK